MTRALVPNLTDLDRHVRAALPECTPGVREREVMLYVWQRDHDGPDAQTIRGVLRGLEHLGLARQAGGWWFKA